MKIAARDYCIFHATLSCFGWGFAVRKQQFANLWRTVFDLANVSRTFPLGLVLGVPSVVRGSIVEVVWGILGSLVTGLELEALASASPRSRTLQLVAFCIIVLLQVNCRSAARR
jgi:hypothetical protein